MTTQNLPTKTKKNTGRRKLKERTNEPRRVGNLLARRIKQNRAHQKEKFRQSLLFQIESQNNHQHRKNIEERHERNPIDYEHSSRAVRHGVGDAHETGAGR